jgi:hypothetical protein
MSPGLRRNESLRVLHIAPQPERQLPDACSAAAVHSAVAIMQHNGIYRTRETGLDFTAAERQHRSRCQPRRGGRYLRYFAAIDWGR